MNEVHITQNFWPDSTQEQLLKAILLRGDRGHEAWLEWSAGIDFDTLDYDSTCLIPSLYMSLKDQGIDSPLLPIMKGLYRKHWYTNQLKYRHLATLQQLFSDQGLATLAIRGTAIALRYYSDPGLRQIEEIDLLIQASQAEQVQACLHSQQWKSIPHSIPYAQRFLHPQAAIKVDLYQYALQTGLETGTEDVDAWAEKEDRLWQAAEPLAFQNTLLRCLCPVDQLLQVFVQGTNPTRVSPYRWVMDASHIIRQIPPLNWDSWMDQVHNFRSQSPIAAMLRYLNSTFQLPMPEVALRE